MHLTNARRFTACLACSVTFLGAKSALAEENIARDDWNHPGHAFELEPHALLAPLYDHGLPGVGVRGTVTLAREGFIDGVNDSVGLGFGADWTRDATYVPIVMQWNFWLSQHWSVFAEPGVALRFRDDFRDRGPDLTLYGGGRFRFARSAALTLRIGYPAVALGVSFFL
jgi:hypothetical protein